MELNRLLSKRLQVPPLKPGETVTFELVNMAKKEPGREEPVTPDYVAISEKENIFDPDANDGYGKNVMLMNVISYETRNREDGTSYEKPMLKKPAFIKGQMVVGHEDNNTYIFMMRSKKNIDNPFRGKGGRRVFRIADKKKEVFDALHEEDIQYSATKLIRESDWNVLRSIAMKLNQSPDRRHHVQYNPDDLQGLKLQLIQKTKSFPKNIILASGDNIAKARVYIGDAITFKILLWVETTRTWTLWDNNAVKDKSTDILTVDPNLDKIDALIDHFRTDEGRIAYGAIAKGLEKTFKVMK